MSSRMIFAVYLAMSSPVLNLFWARMRATASGSMAPQESYFFLRSVMYWMSL